MKLDRLDELVKIYALLGEKVCVMRGKEILSRGVLFYVHHSKKHDGSEFIVLTYRDGAGRWEVPRGCKVLKAFR